MKPDEPKKNNKITFTVVVNGRDTEVEANVNTPLHTIVPEALRETGNTGQPPENWRILRSEERRVGKEWIYQCDWSSDVCSSDLHRGRGERQHPAPHDCPGGSPGDRQHRPAARKLADPQIGRASCRERVDISV